MIVRLPNIYISMVFNNSKICEPTHSIGHVSYAYIVGNEIAGALVVSRKKHTRAISSHGTIVRPEYAKKGIGRRLWMNMIVEENPFRIKVTVISESGYALINSLRNTVKDVRWDVKDNR